MKAHAMAAGVPVLQPLTLKDPEFTAALAALRADIGVVAAYGKILPDAVSTAVLARWDDSMAARIPAPPAPRF